MTSVYTELTKEAKKRGGPVAMRLFYRCQGAALGAAGVTVLITGTQIYYTVRARRSVTTTAAPAPGAARASGPDSQPPGEGNDA